MLYPQTNPYRQCLDISGYWDFRFDAGANGEQAGWQAGFSEGHPIAVPASWNDQLAEGRDELGPAWYQTAFDLPWGWQERRVSLRFGSVNYLAEAWLNDHPLGRHEGGHLPFTFDITPWVQPQANRLVVRVDGQLAPDRVPPGNVPPDSGDSFSARSYPDTNFDFFPFCGIHRPVILSAVPAEGIDDLTITTGIAGQSGLVHVRLASAAGSGQAHFTLSGHGSHLTAEASLAGNAGVDFNVHDAALWSPSAPNLYELCVELSQGGAVYDRYTLPVGIRTVLVDGDALLLNGRPVVLRGFDRHEDFPVVGRGLLPPLVIKDFDLLRWIGANSFRTSHYPYAEDVMALADRLGFLVIDEIPAVGLFFSTTGLERRLALCRQYLTELIGRDQNHPCVIAWSLANEPHSRGAAARAFFRELYDLAKSLDATRPATVVSYLGAAEEAFEFVDLVCLNRYYGWYSESGQLEKALAKLSAELDELHQRFPKPLILAEFGADAIPGVHAQPPEMFSEEYQAELLAGYVRLLNEKPFVAGQHIWNLCDFKTGQAVHRMGGYNYKGVFTRDRRPKLAAHRLRALWAQAPELTSPGRS
jgi:beta-glucuronidase